MYGTVHVSSSDGLRWCAVEGPALVDGSTAGTATLVGPTDVVIGGMSGPNFGAGRPVTWAGELASDCPGAES